MAGRLLMLLLVFLSALFEADAAIPCRIFGALIPKELTEAKLETQGYEVLEPPPLTQEEADRILAAFLGGEKVKRNGARVLAGRIRLPEELRNDPVHGETFRKFEDYLSTLFQTARARLRTIPGRQMDFNDARIDIRANDAGLPNPTAYDSGHADGGYATVAIAIVGPNSIVQPTYNTEVSPPTGAPILMVGKEGARLWSIPPGYHRAPKPPELPPRLFIQMVF